MGAKVHMSRVNSAVGDRKEIQLKTVVRDSHVRYTAVWQAGISLTAKQGRRFRFSNFSLTPRITRRLLVLSVFPGRPLFHERRVFIPLCMMSALSFRKLASQSWLAFPQPRDLVPPYVSSTSASTPASWLFRVVSFAKEGQSMTVIAHGAGALGRDQHCRQNRRPVPRRFPPTQPLLQSLCILLRLAHV